VTDCEVGMGEIKVARNPSTLTCLGLGSCVVLIIYDEVEKTGGIAHIMLPSNNHAQPETRNPIGKYADTAPKFLVKKLLNIGANKNFLKAKIIGGADMFPEFRTDMLSNLGTRTVDVLTTGLEKLGIPVVGEDVGGHQGRSLLFDLENGRVTIKTIFGDIKEI